MGWNGDPDAVIIDLAGHHFLFPGEPLRLGGTLETTDHRATIARSAAM